VACLDTAAISEEETLAESGNAGASRPKSLPALAMPRTLLKCVGTRLRNVRPRELKLLAGPRVTRSCVDLDRRRQLTEAGTDDPTPNHGER